MKYQIAPTYQARPGTISTDRMLLTVFLLGLLSPLQSNAEFSLNFQTGSNVVGSWANQRCNYGGGGGMGGGMGRLGPGCGSDAFLQEIVNDNGVEYYHVIVFDQTEDFSLEFYMRTGGCCWWGGSNARYTRGGMGGGMGGGGTPYSSSYGSNAVNDPLANAWEPLANAADSGNGTGNPARVYMRQINNDSQMNQEFIKALEAMKPRIVQGINDGPVQLTFDLDMSNGGYANYTAPSLFDNTFTLGGVAGADFDMANNAPQANITAGQFSYADGNGDGNSNGSYSYAGGNFDVYAVDWLSYCDPGQNSDHSCNFSRGGGGGMGGGGRR